MAVGEINFQNSINNRTQKNSKCSHRIGTAQKSETARTHHLPRTLSQNGYGDRSLATPNTPPQHDASTNARHKKANSTLRASRAVPHPSTDRAFRRLTSEFGWDRVYSTKYGRWRKHLAKRVQDQAQRPIGNSKSSDLETAEKNGCANAPPLWNLEPKSATVTAQECIADPTPARLLFRTPNN